jgi:preprotein translocase subunit SecD
LLVLPSVAAADPPTATETAAVPNGVYLVLRQGPARKDVQPLKMGEAVIADYERYFDRKPAEPARYLVVHRTPDVPLALEGEPRAVKDEAGSLRVYLTLKKEAGDRLARLTREHPAEQAAVVVAGEAVTVHKIRSAIPDGKVQISGCTKGSAEYLLKQLRQARPGK